MKPFAPRLTKRQLVVGTGALALAGLPLPAAALEPTPACSTGPTQPQTAGPFYSPSAPLRADLREPDTRGMPLLFEGLVLTVGCDRIAGAVVEIWQADENGRYDTRGFRYRGHVVADADGEFRVATVRPGSYSSRTPHIHVRVQGPGTPVLVTQTYFPDEAARNARDPIFSPALLMDLSAGVDGMQRARFDFVLPIGGSV